MTNKQEVVIRKVVPSDAEQYVKLHNLVWKDAYKNIFPEEVFERREQRAEAVINGFADWMSADPDDIYYCAEVDGKLVGFMTATLHTKNEHFKDKNYAEIMGMYIHPDYQGLGIGSKFKNIFVEWARSQGATKYLIGVLGDNHNARKVYEKWGGKLDKHTAPYVLLGKSYDEVFYTIGL